LKTLENAEPKAIYNKIKEPNLKLVCIRIGLGFTLYTWTHRTKTTNFHILLLNGSPLYPICHPSCCVKHA
jgi:hypothetical protein